jgi:O-antigen/teichoic acid export membrane protein/glycosyltransferase involved in cell wall biosynthesis
MSIRDKLSRLPLRELARGGGLSFLLASGTVGLSNFIFHVVVSRLLGPDQYGALGALLNIVLVLAVPLGAVQAAVTRTVALRGRAPIHLRTIANRAIVAGVVGMVVLAGLSPVIAGFLHLSSVTPVLVLALLLVPSVIGAVLQGALIGKLQFTPFAIAMVVGLGVSRLLFGVVLVEAGWGVTGAMLATVASQVVTVGIVAWPLRRELRTDPPGPAEHIRLEHGMAMLFALGGFWVFVGIDTFLARHLMAPHAAGLYAAAATGSRIALFGPAALVTLTFPRFAANHGRGPEAKRLLVQTMIAVSSMGVVIAGLIVALPGPLVQTLFGKSFTGSAGTVGTLAVEAAILGLISLLLYYHLARNTLFAQLGWLGAGVAAVGISLFHRDLAQVAYVMLGTSALVLVLSVVDVFRPDRIPPKVAKMNGDLATDTLDFSIVVPFYNPGPRFGPHLANIVEVLDASGSTFEVIAVSDGSTDGSEHVVSELDRHGVRLIAMPHGGKGSALHAGMTEARGKYVGFIDADGDLPALLISNFIELTRVDNAPDIVLGSKRHPDSDVDYPWLRRLYSLGYQLLIGILFRLPMRDTQTGLKFIRREVLSAVVPRMVEKRFAFDLELLVVARHLGYRQFVEAPVQIGERFSSTVSMRAVQGMILDTLAIFYRLHILRYYDRTPPDAAVPSYSKPTSQQQLSTASASAPLDLEEGAIEVSH